MRVAGKEKDKLLLPYPISFISRNLVFDCQAVGAVSNTAFLGIMVIITSVISTKS